jgi:pyruvate-formate lyase-activating enzyme
MSFADRLRSVMGHQRGLAASGRPYRLVVEISNACNLRCVMCPRNTMTRKVEYMDFAFFESLIGENQDILEYVSLNGYGEPLLHPQLADMIDCCRKHGVGVGISTNCTLLDDNRARMLLEHPPDELTLAVDGLDAQHYERIRQGAHFETVMENVRGFLLRKGNAAPFSILQCIYMPETAQAAPRFRKFFRDLPYDAIRIRQLTHSGRDKGTLFANDAGSCYWLWNEGMVLSSGVLVPCCQDVNGSLALGDLRATPLRALWSTGRISTLRQGHAAGKRGAVPVCRDCNMYQPGPLTRLTAQFVPTKMLQRALPRVESALSALRYGHKGTTP